MKWNNPSPDRGSRNENLPLSNMYRYVVSRKVSLQGEEAEETDQDLASTPVSGQRLSVDVISLTLRQIHLNPSIRFAMVQWFVYLFVYSIHHAFTPHDLVMDVCGLVLLTVKCLCRSTSSDSVPHRGSSGNKRQSGKSRESLRLQHPPAHLYQQRQTGLLRQAFIWVGITFWI